MHMSRQNDRTNIARIVAAAFASTAAAWLLAPSLASAVIIKTNAGAGADARITENVATVPGPTGAASGGSGTAGTIDVRSNGNAGGNADKNEIGLLRFDLTPAQLGGNRADIASAALKLVYARNGPHSSSFDIYGVLPTITGEDNWDESTISFNNAPGMTFDGDTSTRGINAADTTLLGSVSFTSLSKPATVAAIDSDSGVITFSNAALVSFLQQADSDDMVSFIITVTNEGNTQFRLGTKEATSLESTSPVGVAGDFAARLVVEVPEPASLMLVGAGAALLLAGRRRRPAVNG
jgi:hypothetical protein